MKVVRIGRNPDNDLVYSDPVISGSHAEITIKDDGGLLLTDHSTNGTRVNGELLHHSIRRVTTADKVVFPGEQELDWNHVVPPVCAEEQPETSPIVEEKIEDEPQAREEVPHESDSDGFTFMGALRAGLMSGWRNLPSLLGIILLTILTCWIPYVNVCVFIALTTLAPLWQADSTVSPFAIFHGRCRYALGGALLTLVCVYLGSILLLPFMVVPAIVLRYSWRMAPWLVVHEQMQVGQALHISNQCTHGYKWKMFFLDLSVVLYALVGFVVVAGIAYICFGEDLLYTLNLAPMILVTVLYLLISLSVYSVQLGIMGYTWRTLYKSKNMNL